jgi:hypothetical protein
MESIHFYVKVPKQANKFFELTIGLRIGFALFGKVPYKG